MEPEFNDLLAATSRGSERGLPGVLVDGVFWHWQAPVDELHVSRRKGLKSARKFEQGFAIVLGLLGIAGFAILVGLNFQDQVLTDEFWSTPNLASALFWTGLACWLYAAYVAIQSRPTTTSLKDLSPKTEPELTYIPSLAAIERKRDLADMADDSAWLSVEEAYRLAAQAGHAEVTALHLFAGSLGSTPVRVLLARLGVSFDSLKDPLRRRLSTLPTGPTVFGQAAWDLTAKAFEHALKSRRSHWSALDLFDLAVAQEPFLTEVFADHGVNPEELDNALAWMRIAEDLRERYLSFRKAAAYKPTSNMNRSMTAVATPFLDSVSEDLTRAAVYGQTGFLVGRDKEIKNIFRAIEGGNQSVVLVGQPGVGKGALIDGIADLMVEERVPEVLQDKRLMKLSVPHIVSSGANESPDERFLYALSQVAHAGNVVLVIENIHELLGRGSSFDLGSILAQELRKGYTFVVATTTPQGYADVERSILAPTLQKVVIDEPERNDTIKVLEAKVGSVEAKNNVIFTYGALAAIVDLTTRYIHDGSNPLKSLEIMKEVGLQVSKRGQQHAWVMKEDVAELIAERTQIPVTNVTQAEGQELLHLEERVHERVIGQEPAVKAVASALRRARTELRSGNRPIANFLFLGPTGVGKTELAKATAEVYFGSEDSMVRFDMSEYQDQASITRLIGGYGQAGLMTEAVRKNPFTLLLLDELEKANPDILNLFLQVMDDGRLTDGLGRTVDFTNVILIATSNAGTNFIQDSVEAGQTLEQIKQELLDTELRQIYHPEFLNRFDEVIVFSPLTREDMVAIAYLLVDKVVARLSVKGITLSVTDGAIHELAEAGFDPKFGARPLRRTIQDKLENPLAEYLLQGKVGRRDTLVFDVGGEITLDKAPEL